MKKLYIFKLGSTFPETARRLGDFDRWTSRALDAADAPVEILDVEHGAALPGHALCAGIVMTGSHSMVTDDLPWSVALEGWLRTALERSVPILGVCYGHQLLARAAGGRVDYHPQGREIGTVEIQTLPACAADPLFRGAPAIFRAHATHAQSVLELPPGAIHLAMNAWERNHAYRLGECAWGVQFHPEYDKTIMRAYINGLAEQLRSAGRNVDDLQREVTDTPFANGIPRRFRKLAAGSPELS